MDSHHLVYMLHVGVALLLFTFAMLSVVIAVLIAVKPGIDHANVALVKKANVVAIVENVIVGLVILTGVIAMLMGSWPLSQHWLWMSLLIMAFYSLSLVFIVKPARMAVGIGSSATKVGMQVLYQMTHLLMIMVSFAFMFLKPS